MDENDKIRISADALIAMVVTEAEARELEKMPSVEEMDDAFQPSEQFLKKMEKLVKKADSKRKHKKIRHGIKKALIVAATAMSIFFCMLLPVQAVRESVVDTLIEWQDKFMTIIFSTEGATTYTPESITVGYIPDGFSPLEPEVREEDRYYVYYTTPADQWFLIRSSLIENSQSSFLDNEYTTYYSLKFQSHEAIWGILKDDSNILVWADSGLSFQISGNLDLSELIKIAESIDFSSSFLKATTSTQ